MQHLDLCIFNSKTVNTQQPNILSQIENINFNKLKVLEIPANRITTIENIGRNQMINLEKLSVSR